ncbi:regulator of G protein signaling superfamily [Ascobolus immersus RN42]|uniref:Regulator of G protein signaling superfamily n=1 Tax=Ascobolus immersus RN42 TaxID=1160509 RepID=A0A3N4I3A3_ASCIM|nr:regulator of G protein signaling superfamily [Ascobolus immersus RN42]
MRRPPSLNFSISSSEPSPPPTSHSSDVETDSISTSNSRPLSVAASHCQRMPTLADVLSNTAEPPYTLTAFMAYLSQNHCLETLEFTMDASRYRKHFNTLKEAGSFEDSETCGFMRSLWQRLLDAYIAPNGPREVNLPCGIRDRLLSVPNYDMPPEPDCLDAALSKVYELMEESVLIPFINACQCPMAYGAVTWDANQSDDNIYLRGSLDERLLRRAQNNSPPPCEFISHSYTAPVSSTRSRGMSPFSVHLGWGSRNSQHFPGSWSVGSPGAMVEDSPSASPRSRTPITPPSTPPTGELGSRSGRHSPKPLHLHKSADKAWKKMTEKFHWKRKGPASNPDAAADYQS